MSTFIQTEELKKRATRPLFAAVGAGDIAIGYARTAANDVQARLAGLAHTDLEDAARQAPGRLEARMSELQADALAGYADLAARGQKLVERIRNQKATGQVQAEAQKTTAKAKTTATQARKTASTTKRSAKATGTSARKTASATRKATKDAAAKTGS